jgi:saccharopine dehydrogenase (NAD+, L-lysine-forming)
VHLWVRAECRDNEQRVGIMPEGVAMLIAEGATVTVEESAARVVPTERYARVGAQIVTEGAWRAAPDDAVIFGLKELPADSSPLRHDHIMFGHAYKGQPDGPALLARFAAGGGALLDLEYLVDDDGRRVAAFGYWAGYAGAAVSAIAWAAEAQGGICPPVDLWDSAPAMLADVQVALQRAGATRPTALVIGAKGRVGTGVRDACTALGIPTTDWDMAETAHGGPFPEVLNHPLFFNCILAGPGVPVFVPEDTGTRPRALRVIGDIACDPGSDYNPVPVYDTATTWSAPVVRVHDAPPLDVMAIDNLPSLLPTESSEDFAGQLLPHLAALARGGSAVWDRARATFLDHAKETV